MGCIIVGQSNKIKRAKKKIKGRERRKDRGKCSISLPLSKHVISMISF